MKKVTKDDYIQSIYKVVIYIEQNYNEVLTLEELSRVAGFSRYHFHRIFKSIMDETLGNYVRRVRLSKTTMKFTTAQNITQIALSSGYETNSSFSKAFKNYFGMTPKEFSRHIKRDKGVTMLEAKMVELEEIDILYVRKSGDYTSSCSEAWEMMIGFLVKKSIIEKVISRIGIGHDNPNLIETDKLRCDACVLLSEDIKPDGEIQSKKIEGGKYAKFLHIGEYEKLKSMYDAIGEWIVQSGSEVRDLPMFEKYLDVDPRNVVPKDLRTEIYVPIV